MASDRCDNPKLGKMGANGIDHRGLLADEQVPGTVQRQAALLPWRFGRHEPHVRPADRLTNRLGISGIVLMPLHIGLHVGRRHQAHGVAKGLKFARPMMRRGASFDTNQARWQLLKESQDVAALQLAADDHLAVSINAMDLKNRLRDIETDCCDSLHE